MADLFHLVQCPQDLFMLYQVRISFIVKAEQLCRYAIFSWYIHPSINFWYFHFWVSINSTVINMVLQISLIPDFSSLGERCLFKEYYLGFCVLNYIPQFIGIGAL